MEKHNTNGLRKVIYALNAVVALGLVTYCAILLAIHMNDQSMNVFMKGKDFYHQLIWWNLFAEKFYQVCGDVYIVGHIAVIYPAVIKKIPFSRISFYFSVQIGILLLCTVPFVLFDPDNWGDYLFPVWPVLFILCVLFLVCAVAFIFKNRKRVSPGI